MKKTHILTPKLCFGIKTLGVACRLGNLKQFAIRRGKMNISILHKKLLTILSNMLMMVKYFNDDCIDNHTFFDCLINPFERACHNTARFLFPSRDDKIKYLNRYIFVYPNVGGLNIMTPVSYLLYEKKCIKKVCTQIWR